MKGVSHQDRQFKTLIHSARNTQFGLDHDFKSISNYDDYKAHVPVRDYEDFVPYLDQIRDGKQNILWKGLPKYLAKTSELLQVPNTSH